MSDNGTIVLDGLVLSGGGSGGGTADTTSFEPTATIDATNVQDAVEEVDAKAEAVAGDLSDTEINGVAIAGKNNTCDDLGLQCAIKEGNNITKTQISKSSIKLLMKFTSENGIQDISADPYTFRVVDGTPSYGPPLYANSDNLSIYCKGYDAPYIDIIAGTKSINFGTGPFTIRYRRKMGSYDKPTAGYITRNTEEVSGAVGAMFLTGLITQGPGGWTTLLPEIPTTVGAIEEILITRLADGTTIRYKNGALYDINNALKDIIFGFPTALSWFYEQSPESYSAISGLSFSNTPYTGGDYTPSEDYPTDSYVTKDVIACKNYFGAIYTEDNTTAQTIPTGTDYTKLTALNTAGEYRGITLDTANNKMTLPSVGYYRIGITASSKLGTAGVTLKTALFLGGVKVPSCQAVRKINNANDESTVSFGGIVKVDTANSDIDVRVSHDNGGDVSLTTVFCNLNAVYIGDLVL